MLEKSLFGLSAMFGPAALLLLSEWVIFAIRGDLPGYGLILPGFFSVVGIVAHWALIRRYLCAGQATLRVHMIEPDEQKYFDQLLRVLSLAGALITLHFFLFHHAPSPPQGAQASPGAAVPWLELGVEAAVAVAVIALFARTRSLHANLLFFVSPYRLRRAEVERTDGSWVTRSTVTTLIRGPGSQSPLPQDTITFREAEAFALYVAQLGGSDDKE